jgi:hypothetical protein
LNSPPPVSHKREREREERGMEGEREKDKNQFAGFSRACTNMLFKCE